MQTNMNTQKNPPKARQQGAIASKRDKANKPKRFASERNWSQITYTCSKY